MVNLSLWAYLTILTAVLGVVFAVCAFVFVKRLEDRTPAPISEEVGAHKSVLRKLRKGESMSKDEFDYAAEIVSDARSLLAYSIPAAIFTIGAFYVFGCLELLHGAKPSVRTFIGGIPMLTSTNLAIQLFRVARLNGRLQKVSLTEPTESGVLAHNPSE